MNGEPSGREAPGYNVLTQLAEVCASAGAETPRSKWRDNITLGTMQPRKQGIVPTRPSDPEAGNEHH